MAREFSKSFYNSKQWKQIRESVLKRDNYLCQICGAPAQEVHHITHLTPNNIGNLEVTSKMDNLMSLCRDCHMAHHKDEKLQGLERTRTKADTPEDFIFVDGVLTRVLPPV